MTTCDILLAHLCPLNNSSFLSPHIPLCLSLSPFPPALFFSSSLSLSLPESVFFSLSLVFHPAFTFSLYPALGAASQLPSSQRGNRERRGNGIRRISASIKQELRDRLRHIYLLAQSAFISTRVTRAVCYLPRRDTYGRGVRKVSP